MMILISSCESDNPKKSETHHNQEATSAKKLMPEEEIMHAIIDEYKKQYNHLRVEEINDEGWHELSFYGKLDSTATTEQIMSLVRIPNYTLVDEIENNPIKGDLNNDNQDDYLVKVVDEGAGGGGNFVQITYYLFTSRDGEYELHTALPTGLLSGCDEDNGYFVPQKIENQQVIGESLCYAENDGRCCPSLKSKSIAAIEDGEFKLISKEEIQTDVQASAE